MASPDSGLLEIMGQETTHWEPGPTLLPTPSRLTCSTDLSRDHRQEVAGLDAGDTERCHRGCGLGTADDSTFW